MFIRLKKIKGKYYAYHVQNRRVRGRVKQKVKGYIGRAYFPKQVNDKNFFSFVGKDINSYEISLKKTVEDLVRWELYKHGLDDIDNNLITKDGSKVVLKLNEGYLYDKTIKDIIKFYVVGDDEYFIGKEFAEVFVKAGIKIPKELFVKLFEKIVKK